MISFISSFEIINVVIPDAKFFFSITASVAAAAAAATNPNGMQKYVYLMVEGHFSVKVNQCLVMVLKVYLQFLLIVLFHAIKSLTILY